MGKHIVPQQHLRRFQMPDRPGFIWHFDSKTRSWGQPSINKAIQEGDFYDSDVEQELARNIEKPGNIAIDMLRNGETLSEQERSDLALYMFTMHTRGKRHREKILSQMPQALEDVYVRERRKRELMIRDGHPDFILIAAELRELGESRERSKKQLPQSLVDLSRVPFWTVKTVEVLLNMAWHLLPAPDGFHYITTDTPAHLFDGMGIGTPDSEFTITLSSDLALVGENVRPPCIIYESPQFALSEEINNRMLSVIHRFAFSSQKDDWIVDRIDNPPMLNRIAWHAIDSSS